MSTAGTPELLFNTTVPRHLVHRSAICEVFLTDSARHSENEFVLAAQLPRVHSFYSDQLAAPATYDPMLLLECCRQASIFLAHRYHDVPAGHKFILNNSDIRITDYAALVVGARPGHAVLTVTMTDRKYRANALVGFTLRISVSVDDRVAGSVDITIQWMPPEAWDKLRDRARAGLGLPAGPPYHAYTVSRALPPGEVARSSERNVVLGDLTVDATELTTGILVDQGHPGLFDHPLDHVPGMLLFEALRQTAIVTAHEFLGLSPQRLFLTGCQAEFTRFAEFELPLTCHARVGETTKAGGGTAMDIGSIGTTVVDLTIAQGGADVARGRLELWTTCLVDSARQSTLASGTPREDR
jgi:hypothetical protein